MERKKQNFLQKLYSREVHGTFFRGRPVVHNRAIKLFDGKIPDRLAFIVRNLFDRRTEHILLGTTRCGQFLITYTYTSEMPHPVGLQVQYKYRLHWWLFRVMPPACKVAEVQLFDRQDAPPHSLNIGMAQWPNINDRLIVYGYSNEGDHVADINTLSDPADMPTRKTYITVTTLPSLHNCRDCKAVAESFDEEDMALGWDRAISLSCLKHGLTIHTTLDTAPPYPMFDPLTSLKIDNKIIVNTGNFLHVLSFFMDKEKKTPTEGDTIVPDDISHRVGEILSFRFNDYICPWKNPGNTGSLTLPYRKTLSRSINKAWLNTIMDRANKVYAFEETEDGCEPRFKWFKKRRLADKMYEFCSDDDEDMENKCPPAKIPRVAEPNSPDGSKTSELTKAAKLKIERQLIVSDSPMDLFKKRDENEVDEDVWFNRPLIHGDSGVPLVRPERPIFFKSLLPNFWKEKSEHCEFNNKISVPNSSVCDSDVNSSQSDLYSPYSLSTDKPTVSSVSGIRQKLVDTNYRSTQSCLNNSSKPSNTPATLGSDNSPVSSTSENKSLPSRNDHSIPPLDISVINPDLSALLAEWEADSVSSLSPRSDSLSKNDVIQSFLELIPGMTISPRSSGSSSTPGMGENFSSKVNDGTHSACKMSSPNSSMNKYSPLLVVLRTRNCNQDKDPQKTKEQEDRLKMFPKEDCVSKAKSTKESDSLRQRMISGCSVRFDRVYIELDDEMLSTISTDFEDDDQGTGFHCALPLSVHGSAYVQLQLVSSHKAEKLNMRCERVFQSSLDIEQFCFKAADIICKCEGFKFWFCSDYDVELIDVCTINGDILGVVCLRVNAEKKPPKNENYSQEYERCFYGMKCVFVWNPMRDRCWLEAYSPLVETQQVSGAWEAPARREAERLRHHLNTTTLFTLPPHPPIRTFEHRMWANDVLRPPVEEIRDYHNLMAFRLHPHSVVRSFLNQITEFWG